MTHLSLHDHPDLGRALSRPDAALVELDRLDCEESLARFLRGGWRHINPQRFVGGWHLDAMCEHLEAVTRGDIRRLIINIPPRMTKSSVVSVAWPAWTWAQRDTGPLCGPQVQFLSTSYAMNLSTRDAVRSRRLMQSSWYQQRWGSRFHLTGDQNAKTRYENDHGGYRMAVSESSGTTGEGGDIITVDDPHNVVQIESDAVRAGTVQWWDESLSTRLNDSRTGAYVIIMQRLFEDDLTGHVLEGAVEEDDWVWLRLPMEYEPRFPCSTRIGFVDPRTEEGELLCEERVPARELTGLKRTLGTFGTAGQLQQVPVPRGGGILMAADWRAWPPHVEHLVDSVGRAIKPVAYPPMDFILASVDTALTEKEENDDSACVVLGIFHDRDDMPQVMLMEAWEEKLLFKALVNRIMDTCARRKVDRCLIEGKMNGQSVVQEMQRLLRGSEYGVVAESVQGDKIARAHAIEPTLSGGQLWAPARNINGDIRFFSWAQSVIDRAAKFPKVRSKDIVDALTQGVNHLRKSGMLQTHTDRRDELRRRLAPPGDKREAQLYGVM